MQGFLSQEATSATRFTFPFRLHGLLTQAEKLGLSDIVAWHPSGKKFVIHHQQDFIAKVLPNVFKQSMFASFRRQLNAYGFKREIKSNKQSSSKESESRSIVYLHKYFDRDNVDACHKIIRQRQTPPIKNSNLLSKGHNAKIAIKIMSAKLQADQLRKQLICWQKSIQAPQTTFPLPVVSSSAPSIKDEADTMLSSMSDKVLDGLADLWDEDDDCSSVTNIYWDPYVESLC